MYAAFAVPHNPQILTAEKTLIIIVEGSDNAGKTTLVDWLAKVTGYPVQHSGGPGKSREEIEERCNRLLAMDNVIFDRFPWISDRVYAPVLRNVDNFGPELTQEIGRRLMQRRPFIIYCRPPRSVLLDLENHQSHGHDTPGHIEALKKKANDIIEAYDLLMMEVDHIVYDYKNNGEYQRQSILSHIRLIQYMNRMDLFNAVGDFHAKFDLPVFNRTTIGFPPNDVIEFRAKFLREECDEFEEACCEGDLSKAIDALVDLTYVALGTAHMFGASFNDHFWEVHNANMNKERAKGADDPRNTRPHALNVVKPQGWKPPNHEPIIERKRLEDSSNGN